MAEMGGLGWPLAVCAVRKGLEDGFRALEGGFWGSESDGGMGFWAWRGGVGDVRTELSLTQGRFESFGVTPGWVIPDWT